MSENKKYDSGLYWIRERGLVTVAEYDAKSDKWWMIGDDRNHNYVDEVICPADKQSDNKEHQPSVMHLTQLANSTTCSRSQPLALVMWHYKEEYKWEMIYRPLSPMRGQALDAIAWIVTPTKEERTALIPAIRATAGAEYFNSADNKTVQP